MTNALLDRLSVGKKLFLISLFFSAALIGIEAYTITTLNQQRADSTIINIAGRQRMLTQKFTKELLDELGRGGRSGTRETTASANTAKLFEVSLNALRSGGQTFADLGMTQPLQIPGTGDPAIADKLAEVADLWGRLMQAATNIREAEPGSISHQAALKEVRTLNLAALKTMNQAVGMMAGNSAGKITTMMTMEGIILALALIAGLLFSMLVARHITGPLGRVVAATRKIAKGDLDIDLQALRSEARDEVGELARSFHSMVPVLRELQQELESMTQAAAAGELDRRCDNSRFNGSWSRILDGVNRVIDQFTGPLANASDYLDRISHGDIPEPITEEYRGDFNRIKDSVNRCIEAMNGLLDQSDDLIAAARGGRLDHRSDSADFEGSWKELITGLNGIFDAVTGPVQGTRHILQLLAEGNLSRTLEGDFDGEFGALQQAVNDTIEHLRKTIGPIQEAADLIDTASKEITAGNNNLSSRTESQASSLEETASSMEQLTSTVKHNADNAQQGKQLATRARQLAEAGGKVVDEAVQAMDEITESSRRIAEIIGVIDEIAFQTNLLALNASVEAARAGEQGRGFAVVATEVRNLAGRSATAAKEIKTLINDSVAKVDNGTQLVHRSGETLEEIVAGVKKVGDIVAEITAASQEQAAGIDQVNQAVTGMDEITQQNAALAEEISAAAAAMMEKAQELRRLTGFFRLNGAEPSQAHPPASSHEKVVKEVA